MLGRRRRLRSHLGYGGHELHLVPSMTPEGMSFRFDHPADRFAGDRFLQRYLGAIAQVLAGADRLGDIDLVLPGEPRVIESPRPTSARPPSVVEALDARVEACPDAPAVSDGRSRLTYGQLGERTHQLAHHLATLGAGPDQRVAIALDRSVDLVVAIVAVLQTGAAYVPLEPTNPPSRLQAILEDSGASQLITTGPIGGELDPIPCPVTLLDREGATISSQPPSPPTTRIDPEGAAYVIYTSGSTGQPKGVVVSHGNLSALLAAARDVFDFTTDDVWTMFHSAAFDYSVWEIFGALSTGGHLVIVPHATTRSPEELHRLLTDEQVTVLSQTPTAFSALSAWDARLARRPGGLALRHVVFGGEALSLEALAGWVDVHGDAHPALTNMYGITETTVHCTHRRISGVDIGQARGRSPIGTPLPGWSITLRDAYGLAVPPGVTGEIYVGGDGVAQGYLDRPELDAERFVELADRPGERWYRSGDLGVVGGGGELEYLGRADAQVKIRGHRVEPGEVEAALVAVPRVEQAAVVVRRHGDEPRLTAFFVAASASAPTEVELRSELAARLPDYLVPWRILEVAALPLTANGKLDRAALPFPGEDRPELEVEFVEPATPLQGEIARIWEDVLGVGPIGVRDEFFALGGNSLTATQMMLRVHDRLGTALPLCTAFEHTNVAALAEVVEASGGSLDAAGRDLPDPAPPPRPGGPLPLTFAQERAWYVQQLSPSSIAYHFTATLTWRGELDTDALARALTELVERHEVLRTTFPAEGGRPAQQIHRPWRVQLDVEDCAPADVEHAVREISTRPFVLDELPLIRWRLLRLDARHHVLVHVEHHLLHDGWTFAVVLRELLSLYEAFASGHPSPLLPARWQSADAALRERRWIETRAADDQLAYWVDLLADVTHVMELPADRARPAIESFRGDAVRVRLDDRLAARVEAYSRDRGVTPNTTLRATFEALIGRLTGLERFVIGSGVASRRTPALESVVGMLLNNLALPADLTDAPDLDTSVSRVQATVASAIDHQDIPYDRVVAAVDPERVPGRSPLCQVFFSSYDGPVPAMTAAGLTVEPVFGVNNGSAKFDLNVIVVAVPTPRSRPEAATRSIEMIWEFRSDLFARDSVQRWSGWFLRLLESALDEPDRPLVTLPVMSSAERELVVGSWNATTRPYPLGSTMPEIFDEVARSAPHRTALTWRGDEVTYAELLDRAQEFAAGLQAQGIGPRHRVGLCLERSPDTIAAMLGTLIAGAAYVPLDPADPPARRAVLAAEASLDLVHGDPTGTPTPTVERSPRPSPDAAYVMFTSGSTGAPKGVEVTHRNVARLVCNTDYASLGPDQVLLQMAPLTFDASTFEIWGALLNGGRLVLWPEREFDLTTLAEVIRRDGGDHPVVDVEPAARRGSLPPRCARRARSAARRGRRVAARRHRPGAPRLPRPADRERLRPDGGNDLLVLLPGSLRPGHRLGDPDRSTDRQHDGIRARPPRRTGTHRGAG